MLSALLKSDIAIKVSINIMKAFIEMRKFILNNGQVFERLTNVEYELLEQNKMLTDHEKKFLTNYKKMKRKNLNKRYFLMGKFMMHIA